MKKIPLTDGTFALVDDQDYERLAGYKWYVVAGKYVARTIKHNHRGPTGHSVMHREVMGAIQGQEVDHINLDKRDNRRENLRFCTHQQNMCNRLNRSSASSSSRYRGVRRVRNRWGARIKAFGKELHLGYFETEDHAAIAYDIAARKLFGEFARTNTVDA